MSSISLNNVKNKLNMKFLKRGMRVSVNGKFVVVTSGNDSLNINVRYDGNNYSQNVHPKWETRYFDKEGNVIVDYTKESGYIKFDGAKLFNIDKELLKREYLCTWVGNKDDLAIKLNDEENDD